MVFFPCYGYISEHPLIQTGIMRPHPSAGSRLWGVGESKVCGTLSDTLCCPKWMLLHQVLLDCMNETLRAVAA